MYMLDPSALSMGRLQTLLRLTLRFCTRCRKSIAWDADTLLANIVLSSLQDPLCMNRCLRYAKLGCGASCNGSLGRPSLPKLPRYLHRCQCQIIGYFILSQVLGEESSRACCPPPLCGVGRWAAAGMEQRERMEHMNHMQAVLEQACEHFQVKKLLLML